MILEAATAAAMYWGDRWIAARDTPARPQTTAAQSCSRYSDPAAIRECLTRKMQTLQQPDGDMWDEDWISSVQPVTEGEQATTSAKAAKPKHGHSKQPVAEKPHT